MIDETGNHFGSWNSPEDWREFEAKLAKRVAKEKAARAKAERKLERERIRQMEKLDYEFTGFGPDGTQTFRKVKTWHEETAVRSCAGGRSEMSGSSPGPSKAALASAARAQRAARKLKSSSVNGSPRAGAEPGRVIPLKS